MNIIIYVLLVALIFAGYKFTFWANATIFLSVMQRKIDSSYWKLTGVEVISAGIAAMSVAYAVLFEYPRLLIAVLFVISSLVWLFYMTYRVWSSSEPIVER